ncbi:hypothetical protein PED38_11580 [Clavibacter sp. CT19]|uniref:hypothetical protein n=1 Tax=Clavibacter sp. CT19 TaxID=3018990 RepID=UPI0022EB07FF|nr:hypothetical protein [Clavibacter sp. CT19]MDA3805438.1 hypothetical protein [Clavibacter sp. CT19]
MTDKLPPSPRLDGPSKGKKPMGCAAVAALGCGGVVVIVIAVMSIAALTSTRDDAPPAEGAGDDKYTQTWTSSYSETSCREWNEEMTTPQKFAASADILTSARNKIDGGTGLPSDSLITEFSAGITNVCIIPTMTLTDATYGLYTTEPRFHP